MLLKSQIRTLNEKCKVILASRSPRRQELLERIGVTNFKLFVSDFAEDLDKSMFGTAADYCNATAIGKANDILKRLACENIEWDIVICADTIVVLDKTEGEMASGGTNFASFEIMEKASNPTAAFEMIQKLQGRRHEVITALVVIFNRQGGRTDSDEASSLAFSSEVTSLQVKTVTHAERVSVQMAPLSDDLIREYVSDELAWRGKAGAYGIQDAAACFIEGVFGDYYSVMGLPVHQLSIILSENVPL